MMRRQDCRLFGDFCSPTCQRLSAFVQALDTQTSGSLASASVQPLDNRRDYFKGRGLSVNGAVVLFQEQKSTDRPDCLEYAFQLVLFCVAFDKSELSAALLNKRDCASGDPGDAPKGFGRDAIECVWVRVHQAFYCAQSCIDVFLTHRCAVKVRVSACQRNDVPVDVLRIDRIEGLNGGLRHLWLLVQLGVGLHVMQLVVSMKNMARMTLAVVKQFSYLLLGGCRTSCLMCCLSVE